jgi:hypothetical protein
VNARFKPSVRDLPSNFLAARLDCDFDHARIAREIMDCEEFFVYTPPYQWQVNDAISGEIPFMSESQANYRRIDTLEDAQIRKKKLRGVRIFYLRNSTEGDVRKDSRFTVTKGLSHASWFWRPELAQRISYTIQCIESLPYSALGLIRVFVCDSTFMPTHRDTRPPVEDRTKSIGISLIPATGGVGMLIWDDAKRRAHEVKGNCLLFDDSRWHGVPMTRGVRITMRIFGDLDYGRLASRFTRTYLS